MSSGMIGQVRSLLAADSAELSMELAAAYPPEAGIRSWRRTVRLARAGAGTGDGKITIDDAWDLDHFPERAVVYLIAAREPRPWAPGRLGLVIADGDGRNLAIDYPRADFDADIEERALDDRQLAATGAAVSTGSRSQPGILPPRVLLTLRSARLDGRHGRFGATASGQLILAGLTVGLHSSLLALGSVSARTQG